MVKAAIPTPTGMNMSGRLRLMKNTDRGFFRLPMVTNTWDSLREICSTAKAAIPTPMAMNIPVHSRMVKETEKAF